MLVHIHHASTWLRILVSAIAAIVFSLLVITSAAQPGYSVEGQLATHAADIAHIEAKQATASQDVAAVNARISSMSDRLTRIETFGAACFVILTVLQAIGAMTGRRLRLETAKRGD